MYIPRTLAEIESDLRALLIARTPLTDFTEGSVAGSLVRAIAHQFAATERSLYKLREGYFVGLATGDALDKRVAELPPVGLQRITATPSSGAVLKISRATTVGVLVIPAGSTFATQAGINYRTLNTATIVNGAAFVSGVYVVATTPGANTNAEIGEINVIISGPDGLTAVENTIPLTNGADAESDAELQARALSYIQSLSRSQPAALDFLARSFISSSGERMRFVNVFEDVEQPGYTEVIIDDGTGLTLEAVSVEGETVTGTIPTAGYFLLYHESPATAPITAANLSITRAGVQIPISNANIVSIPERGIIYVKASAGLLAGDTWRIAGYRVYRGYIAELQAEIEGSTANPSILSGFRAAGTRVMVRVPERQIVLFDVNLQVATGISYDDVELAVRNALTGYISTIPPGQPLFASALIAVARGVFGVRDVMLFNRNSTQPLQNVYPSSPRVALRADSTSLVITQTPSA